MTQNRSLISTRRCTVAASASVSNSSVSAISVRPTGASRSTPSVPRASQWPSAITRPPRSCTPMAVATALMVTPAQATSRIQNHLHAGPFLEPALQPFHKNAALHGLQFGADADRLQLRDDALAARIIVRYRRHPVDIEAIRITGLCHQLLGL